MEVHFTPEQEAQLTQIATNAGTDAERLVKDAALRLLKGDAGFRPSLPAVWLQRCVLYAPESNLTPPAGPRAITSVMVGASSRIWF